MGFFQDAEKKLREELPKISGPKEGAIKQAAMEALLNFAGQEEEFAQAIVQGGKFADCMKAVCKGIGTSISDLEVYRRAAGFYFPGSTVRFEMHIDLVGAAGGPSQSLRDSSPRRGGSQEDAGDGPMRASAPTENAAKKGGLVINLEDFL